MYFVAMTLSIFLLCIGFIKWFKDEQPSWWGLVTLFSTVFFIITLYKVIQ
jgi:hypothetical protein